MHTCIISYSYNKKLLHMCGEFCVWAGKSCIRYMNVKYKGAITWGISAWNYPRNFYMCWCRIVCCKCGSITLNTGN